MNIFDWIVANWELVGICFGILVNAIGVVYNICKFCRSGRLKALQHAVTLTEAAREFELEAERFEGYTAAEKLHYVLSRLRTLAADLGCAYDEERLTAQIEADIAFTKRVNAPKGEILD